jgi:hypothetical protein
VTVLFILLQLFVTAERNSIEICIVCIPQPQKFPFSQKANRKKFLSGNAVLEVLCNKVNI